MPKSVNEQLLDRAIMHSHYIQRFTTQEAHRIINFLKREVIPDIVKEIKRLEKFGIPIDMRQSGLLKDLRSIVNTGLDRGFEKLFDDMVKFSVAQASFETKLLEKLVPVDVSFNMPNPETLRTLLKKSVFTGRDIKGIGMEKLFTQFKGSMRKNIVDQMRIGLTKGESVPELLERVRGTGAFAGQGLNQSIRNAEAVTRTITNHVSTQTREQVYRDNSDIIKGVQYVATLDANTTDICMSLDGQVFDVFEGPRPPMHYNCRSTTVPVTKSFEEMGMSLKDVPEGTRRAMNGKVAASMTYPEWLKKQGMEGNMAVVREALGPARAKLFINGELDIKQFVSSRYETLTLKELSAKFNIDLDNVPFAPKAG